MADGQGIIELERVIIIEINIAAIVAAIFNLFKIFTIYQRVYKVK